MTNKQKPSAVYKSTQSKQHSGLLSLLWMVLAVVIAAALLVALYFSPLAQSYRNSTKIVVVEEEPVRPIAQTQTIPAPDFEFYDVLPKQDFRSVPEGVSVQETVSDEAQTLAADAVVQSTEATIEVVEEDATYDGDDGDAPQSAAVTYILQIRSYPDAKEADDKRAEVMLAGVDALVVRRVDKATGASFYQVVSMPMTSRAEASQALLKLRNNGIDAMMVEQRHQ